MEVVSFLFVVMMLVVGIKFFFYRKTINELVRTCECTVEEAKQYIKRSNIERKIKRQVQRDYAMKG